MKKTRMALAFLMALSLILSMLLFGCTGKGDDKESTKKESREDRDDDSGKSDSGKKDDDSGKKESETESEASGKTDGAPSVSSVKEQLHTAKAGDTFQLGSFEQDGNDKNGKEPIEWTVICQDVGKALVLSSKVLAEMEFQKAQEDEDSRWVSAIWPDCDLRAWLNGEFYEQAFSEEEKELIEKTTHTTDYVYDYQPQQKDSEEFVFCLSAEEEMRYVYGHGALGYGIPTDAVMQGEPYMSDVEGVEGVTQAMGWWLRDTGFDSSTNALDVPGYEDKADTYGMSVSSSRGVRPAMWIVYDRDYMEAYEKGEAEPPKDEELDARVASATKGNTIEFGSTDLNPSVNDGYENLKWMVIDETDSALFLISEYPYWTMRFMDIEPSELDSLEKVNWEMSDIRKTLNSAEFMNSIFTPQEKAKIRKTHNSTSGSEMWDRDGGPETDDYLFLPDITEMDQYFPDESSRAFEEGSYWLRSPEFVVPYMGKINYSGQSSNGEANEYNGVRVMMWIIRDGDATPINKEDETQTPTEGEEGSSAEDESTEEENTEAESRDEEGTGTKTGGSESGEEERSPGDKTPDSNMERPVVESKYHFDSLPQAEIAMQTGLAEYRANLRGDRNGEYTQQIENKYINHYLIPYIEVLQKNQHLVDPSTVNSQWFSEENDNMKDKAEDSSYSNIYKKYAQDMLPYMLPDPDEMLDDLLAMFKRYGMSGDDAGKKVDPAAVLEDYNNYDPKWYEIDWTYNWEELNRDFHYCYPGSSYGLSGGEHYGAAISFTAPRYNEHYFINTIVFGPDDDENYMTIAPWSNASNLLTEIQTIRDLSPSYVETYIQEISVAVTAGSEGEVDAMLREALAIINPYNSESGRRDILQSAENDRIWVLAGSETEYEENGNIVYEWNMEPRFIGHEELLRYDPALEYWTERDYTPTWGPEPLYNLNTWSENPYSPGYMVDGWCSYFNHTCDQHVDYRIDSGTGDGYVSKVLTIRYAGPTANAMNERYNRNDGGSSVADLYGIYYPLILPIYYNEAAKNGFFTPYVVPEPREDEDLGSLIPDYGFESGQYSEDNPYVSTTELESETEKMTRHLRDGYSKEEKHSIPDGWQEREKMDMSNLGYTQNEDGTWTREMSIEDPDGINTLKKYTLTYDETGLLISGYKEFNDGTTRTIDFKTDAKGNPIESIDRYYDKDGNMYAHSASSYWPNGGCSSRTWYSTEVVEGAGGYRKLENVTYDTQGNMTSWTKFDPNGSPAYQKVISRWTDQAAGSTVGTLILVEYTLVTDTEHDEYGNVINSYEKQFAVRQDSKDEQKQRDALYDYLEDKTGVRRGDWP